MAAAVGGCDDKHDAVAHWKVVGSTRPPGMRLVFVEMSPQYAKDRGEYDRAVIRLCESGTLNVAFFLPSDMVPPSGTTGDFFNAGGWKGYKPVALGWCGQTGDKMYTVWDCNRAGVDGAPEDALCGEGVEEAYKAILSLGSEVHVSKACGWRPNPDDRKIGQAYIATLTDLKRKASWQKAFDDNADSTLPYDVANCPKVKKTVQGDAAAARKLLTSQAKK
jgi:hypothetical protein